MFDFKKIRLNHNRVPKSCANSTTHDEVDKAASCYFRFHAFNTNGSNMHVKAGGMGASLYSNGLYPGLMIKVSSFPIISVL